MKINICVLDAGKKIETKYWALIKDVAKKHTQIAGRALSLTKMNICIYPNEDWCIKQTGDGGYAASSDWIQLFIDPTKQALIPKVVERSFPANIYHEMHHARRMIKIGFGQNLLETVISEGLATVFAEEMFKKFKAPWGEYSKSEIKKLFKIFDPNKYDKKFNYEEWFLGYGKPRWLGYKLGTYVIKELKRKDNKLSCDKMVDIPAVSIYKNWHNSNEIEN